MDADAVSRKMAEINSAYEVLSNEGIPVYYRKFCVLENYGRGMIMVMTQMIMKDNRDIQVVNPLYFNKVGDRISFSSMGNLFREETSSFILVIKMHCI